MEIQIQIGSHPLFGELEIPIKSKGIVLFAHGSGSGRHSSRNQFVAKELQKKGCATLLFDLLTLQEEAIDARTSKLRFDIPFLAKRLIAVTDWVVKHHSMPISYFGASTGAAAALTAAAEKGNSINAVVSRGGRPDLVPTPSLAKVTAPTLLIVGGLDSEVIQMNEKAYAALTCSKKMEIIPGASHLFEEPGKLAIVARLAADWFTTA